MNDQRLSGSHVHEDGRAKVSYEKREQAAQVADLMWMSTGRQHNPYRCAQRPEHWHVGRGGQDLKES